MWSSHQKGSKLGVMEDLKSVLTRSGLFEQAPLHSQLALQPFCPNLSGQKVCVCVFVFWDNQPLVCVCAVDEEGAVSPAMMAPYLGHFCPSSGELLTALALSTHTNSNVTVLTPRWVEHTLQRPVCELSWSNWLLFFFFCLFVSFWKMKELNEKEGGTNPLTLPERRRCRAQMGVSSMKGLQLVGPPAGLTAGQRFLFSTHNDRSSLYKPQKGQSLIDMCESPYINTPRALSRRAHTHRALSES